MILQLIFIFLTSLIGCVFLIKYAKNLKLVDFPNIRSSHYQNTAKGYGIIIFLSCLLSCLIFNFSFFIENIYCFIAIFLILILGLLDDIKHYPPIIKILVPLLSYVFLYIDGFIIEDLGIYFGNTINLGYISSILFTLFALIAYTNAFNLIDGIDGLSGTLAIIILSTFIYLGFNNNDIFLILFPSMFIVSLIVFLLYNWNPAKVFLGNSGSLLIGFLITLLGIKSLDYIQPIAILYIAAIPIFDSIIVFCRRIKNKGHPFKPDNTHLHHILLYYTNQNINRTVIIIASIQAFFSLIGIIFVININDSFFPFLFFLIILLGVYFLTQNYKDKRY